MAYGYKTRNQAKDLFLSGECPTPAWVARKMGLAERTVQYWADRGNWYEERDRLEAKASAALTAGQQDRIVDTNNRYYTVWNIILGHLMATMNAAKTEGRNLTPNECDVISRTVWRAQQGHGVSLGMTKEWNADLKEKERDDIPQLTEAEIDRELERIDAAITKAAKPRATEADASPRETAATG